MKKINLNSVAFLVLGVFLLVTPALSQAIITSLVTAFYRNIDLLVWVNLAQNFWILNLLPKVVGAALVAGFVWKHLKTRFKCDLPKIKVQTTRLATYSLLFMLCTGLFIFADVPVSEAATTATTGYILDTPVAEHAWLIGAYSDGTYYAIEGSTWDNKVAGVGSTAWASYKTNSTKITDLVLDSTTSGSIYMKDVAFDMDLFDDIPEDVRVICSYNAEYWEYINSADSSGSPYTVSVGSGVNVGYYLAADSEGRICFTSSNQTALQDTVLGATTSGEIRLNEVAFDLALFNSIPENVAVVESVNELSRTFINPLDKAGSPYTINVVGANYFGADKNNQICYTNTVPNTLVNAVVALGGNINICNGDYTGTALTVPATANIKAELGVTGITYTAIANGAKIDEPTFNSQFLKYSRGELTVSTNGTSYIAFKPDNSIYYFGTSASGTLQSALNAFSDIFVSKGTFTLTTHVTVAERKLLIGSGRATTFFVSSTNNSIIVLVTGNSVVISGIFFKSNQAALSNGLLTINTNVKLGHYYDLYFDRAGDLGTSYSSAIQINCNAGSLATGCSFNNFENIFISGAFRNGISLYSSQGRWISGNIFKDITIQSCTYGIRIIAPTTAADCSNNIFQTILYQTGAFTTVPIVIEGGKYNRFYGFTAWDLPGTAVTIAAAADLTLFEGGMFGVITNNGTNTQILNFYNSTSTTWQP